MSEEIKVRIAVPEDEAELMRLAMAVFHENGLFDADYEKILGMIRPALYLWEGICGVIGPIGALEGGVLLRFSQLWYGNTKYVEEKCLFVDDKYRKERGGRANKLCEFSKQVSDSLELPLVIGVMSNTRTRAKMRMYERHFGEPAGTFFLYKAKTGDAPDPLAIGV
jgi:hypothetical protein